MSFRSRSASAASESQGQVKLQEVDAAICSSLFWAYMEMVSLLGSAISHVTAWCEGCSCHPYEFLARLPGQLELPVAHHSVRKRPAAHQQRCPMASRRAPEAAAGDLHACMQDCLTSVNSALLLNASFQECDEEARVIIMSDLGNARRHTILQFQLKLGHWSENPWRLCGLAHHLPDKQREAAVAALQMYLGAGDDEDHHWLTHCFCSPDGVAGRQMRLLAAGEVSAGPNHEILLCE